MKGSINKAFIKTELKTIMEDKAEKLKREIEESKKLISDAQQVIDEADKLTAVMLENIEKMIGERPEILQSMTREDREKLMANINKIKKRMSSK
ncbi:hypothetical protein DRN74_00970 [Candidatus Micrarchaeota archaeon]|nr:MAG: hypothetical protein DRN74_00970 [Candidatus Micrarchaeota archaeon]